MAVTIPQMVCIQNKKLSNVYYSLWIGTGCLLLANFFLTAQYLREVSLAGTSSINMWTSAPSDELLSRAMDAHMADVCGRPRDYDYWRADGEQYSGAVCRAVQKDCNKLTGACLASGELYEKLSPTEIFITTFLRLQQRLPSSEVTALGLFYLPQAEAYSVSFEYAFTVPGQPMLVSQAQPTPPPEHEQESYTNAVVATAMLDAQRNVIRAVEPGGPLTLTVPELLNMAGYPEALVEPDGVYGRNVFPSATYPEGPIGLVAGMTVELYIHCHRKPKLALGPELAHWKGPTCYVIATARKVWTQKHVTHTLTLEEGDMLTTNGGFLIRGEIEGTWEFFDINNSFLNFAALLVLLNIPHRIVIFMACRCVGQLSKIYARAAYMVFNIGDQIGGMSARVVTNQNGFRELEAVDQVGGVERECLHDIIASLTHRHRRGGTGRGGGEVLGLTDADARRLSDFAFNSMQHPVVSEVSWLATVLHGTRLGHILDEISFAVLNHDFLARPNVDQPGSMHSDIHGRITTDHFLVAATSNEPMSFQDLTWFFNKDRKSGIFERICVPKALQKFKSFDERQMVTDKVRKSQRARRTLESPRSRGAQEHLRALHDVGDMVRDIRLSNRQVLNAYLHTSRGFLDTCAKTQGGLLEDLLRVQRSLIELEDNLRLARKKGRVVNVHEVSVNFAKARSVPKLVIDADGEGVADDHPSARGAGDVPVSVMHTPKGGILGRSLEAYGLAGEHRSAVGAGGELPPARGPRCTEAKEVSVVSNASQALRAAGLAGSASGSGDAASIPQVDATEGVQVVLDVERLQLAVLASKYKVDALLDKVKADGVQPEPSPLVYDELAQEISKLDELAQRLSGYFATVSE